MRENTHILHNSNKCVCVCMCVRVIKTYKCTSTIFVFLSPSQRTCVTLTYTAINIFARQMGGRISIKIKSTSASNKNNLRAHVHRHVYRESIRLIRRLSRRTTLLGLQGIGLIPLCSPRSALWISAICIRGRSLAEPLYAVAKETRAAKSLKRHGCEIYFSFFFFFYDVQGRRETRRSDLPRVPHARNICTRVPASHPSPHVARKQC